VGVDLEHAAAIARGIGIDEHGLRVLPISGGDIAQTYVLQSHDGWIFLKTLPLGQAGLLSAEADGLEALRETGTVRVPGVIKRGLQDRFTWLALEYLDLQERSERADRTLGTELAALHQHTGEHFGWRRNNYLGRTPQPNRSSDDWREFFAEQRLVHQFNRLINRQDGGAWPDLRNEVVQAWLRLTRGYRPQASLIHGDLWRGNAAALGERPVVYDPAVHYADRECDLAMADLFGGFAPEFFQAYQAGWPLETGWEQRRPFYKLYHLLNHANLFGGGYRDAVAKLSRRLIGN